MDKLLTISEAGIILERTAARVSQLITEGEIKAERFKRGKREYIRLRESTVWEYKRNREIPESMPTQ